MTDFSIRSDSVDVERIMRQIRTRIKEKRGVDYTEEEVRELAGVKLEKFLNPRAVRSELVEHYRRQRPLARLALVAPPDNFPFDDTTLYESHRGLVRWIRRLLNPILKLFFNPNRLIDSLHQQHIVNAHLLKGFHDASVARDELDALNFEVLNNIVLELTRATIEVKNLKMRIEAMGARQEFNERRARAVEGLVAAAPAPAPGGGAGGSGPVGREGGAPGDDAEGRARRRRRRRGRRRPDGDSGGSSDAVASSPADDAGGAAERPATPPPSQDRSDEPPPGADQ